MRPFIGVLVFLSAILGSTYAVGADRCVQDGDKVLFGAKTWSDLRQWRKEFPECDDGYLADGVSDFVSTALANRWSELPSLKAEIDGDAGFRHFVLRHVDATAGPEHLETIVDNATNRCPRGEGSLCSAVADAARVALREDAKSRGLK